MNSESQIGKDVLKNTEILERTILIHGEDILNNIKNDASFSIKLSELHRLKSTLSQYIDKSSNLEYIAFVGHFSSGKSSTINTLLDLWDTTGKRSISQQPTDTAITLITHPKNSSLLIGSHKKGELIVNSKEIDSLFLKNKVIIDTPGSGDPTILNEMVKDYLAMCDRVIYTLTAAVPLDNNDIPILQKAFQELPFIPLKFIITRANEFIEDIDEKFSKENISQAKIDKFTSELIARLENAIPDKKFTPNDFLYIDNRHNYNTKALQNYIFNEQKHDIHEHKIKYFIKNLKETRDFFYQFILEQEKSLNDLVSSAEANHEKFKEIAILERDKIKTLWADSFSELTNKQEKLATSVNKITTETSFIKKASETKSFQNFEKEISNTIDDSVKEIANKIFDKIDIYFTKILSDLKALSRTIINDDELGDIKFDEIKSRRNYKIDVDHINFPKHIIWSIKRLDKNISEEIDYFRMENISTLEKISNHITNNSYTKIENDIAEKSTAYLNQVLDKHFKYVDLYRTAILAKNGMQLAEKLKLGEAIDKLDQAVLSDNYKDEIKNKVIQKLYGNRLKNRNDFIENIQDLKKSIHELKRNSPVLDHTTEEPNLVFDGDFKNKTNELFNPNVFSEKASRKLRSIIIRHQKEHRDEIDLERSNFKRKVIKKITWGLSFGIIAGLSLLTFFSDFFQTEVFSSLISNELTRGLIIQILILIISASISFMSGNYRAEHKRHLNQIPKSRKNQLHNDIDHLESYILSNKENQKKSLAMEIEKRLRNTISTESNRILEQQNSRLKSVTAFSDSVNNKIKDYKNESNTYLEKSKKIYKSSDENIKELNSAANNIRDKAIEPSFVLFKTRKDELNTLSKTIQEIEFI